MERCFGRDIAGMDFRNKSRVVHSIGNAHEWHQLKTSDDSTHVLILYLWDGEGFLAREPCSSVPDLSNWGS